MDPLKSKPLASVEAEMSYLGSLIFDPTMIPETASLMKAEMFSVPKHAVIFLMILEIYESGRTPELALLNLELHKIGASERTGGPDYLMALVEGVANSSSASMYAKEVREYWQRRTLVEMFKRATQEVIDTPHLSNDFDPMGIINRAITAIGDSSGESNMVTLSDVIRESINFDKTEERPTVTRIGKVDGAINLFAKGALSIVAARPSVGKSSLMRQIVENAASAGDVLVFSLEVVPKTLGDQMACELAGVPYWTYDRKTFTDDEVSKIVQASASPLFQRIHCYKRSAVSALDVSFMISQSKAKGRNVVAVVIDYLGLMRHDRKERNDLAIGATTGLLKQTALEKQVPIILLAQLNREVEKRGGSSECDRPRLADLRDSGNIEQDADNVIFLWRKEREDQYKTVEPRVLTVAKHRNGQVFEVDLMFDKAKGRFYEVNERGMAPPVPEWESK